MNSFIQLRNAILLELGITYYAAMGAIQDKFDCKSRAPHNGVQPPRTQPRPIEMENGCVIFNAPFEGPRFPPDIRQLITSELESDPNGEEVSNYKDVKVFIFDNSDIAPLYNIFQYTRNRLNDNKQRIFPNLKGIKCGNIEVKNNEDLRVLNEIVNSIEFLWCGSIVCSNSEQGIITFDKLKILQIKSERLITNVQLNLPNCRLIWLDPYRTTPHRIADGDNVLSITPNEVNTNLRLDYYCYHAMQRLKLVGFKFVKSLFIRYDDNYREFDDYFEQLFTELEGLEKLEISCVHCTIAEFDMVFHIVRTKLNLKAVTIIIGRDSIKFLPTLNDKRHMMVTHTMYPDAAFISQCEAACLERNAEIDRQNHQTLSSIKVQNKGLADVTISNIMGF
jgi:hypothetical protein